MRELYLPLVVNDSEQYAKPAHGNKLRYMLLSEHERYDKAHPGTPPTQMVVLFCILSGPVHYLNSCMTKYVADHME